MRKVHLCAFLSVVSLAALQTLPAASQQRQLSQERWMLRQDSGARTDRRPEIRVHFFNPNQVVRVSQHASPAPACRPTFLISRPAPARPLVFAANRTAPRLLASHEAVGAPARVERQSEVRSGR
ncbi:MAG TPA: hypothetical protein VH394_17860 [Thermoanaerobaculia bacterium]|jgi:hypothetical protein|nr:hypothetical protein [Thermoanaerobaculia bacterium]